MASIVTLNDDGILIQEGVKTEPHQHILSRGHPAVANFNRQKKYAKDDQRRMSRQLCCQISRYIIHGHEGTSTRTKKKKREGLF